MEILAISPTPTHPARAGNRARLLTLLRGFQAEGHKVHFAYVAREGDGPEMIAAMQAEWDGFSLIAYDREAERPGPAGVYGLDDWFPPAVEAALEGLAATLAPDMVLVEYVFLSKALTLFPRAIRVLDAHDRFADRHLALDAAGVERSFYYTTPAEEARGLGRADLVLALREDEARAFRRAGARRVEVVGYDAPPPYDPPAPTRGRGLAIGYLGSGNPLNVNAIERFLEHLDLDRLEDQGASLTLAGEVCRKLPADLAGPVVRLAGRQADPAAFFAGCGLVVNPHVGGTGLKIKTVEALAAGVAVIGTAEAFAGIETDEPMHALADPASVAASVRALTENPDALAGVKAASRRAYARYTARVEAALALFRDRGSLAQATMSARTLIVTDVRFWDGRAGNQARLVGLLGALPSAIRGTVFFLGPLRRADRMAIEALNLPVDVVAAADCAAGAGLSIADRCDNPAALEREHWSGETVAALERYLRTRAFDLAVLEYTRLGYLRLARGMPSAVILDIHDLIHLRVESFRAHGRKPHPVVSAEDEWEALSKVPMIGCIQRRERDIVRARLPGAALYLRHVLPVRRASFRPGRPRTVGFIGGGASMNRVGLDWFVRQVWPCFAELGLTLRVAGKVCERLETDDPTVIRLGEVDDLEAFYDGLDLAVNPVFFGGGGLKIKSAEYLARGLPAILTAEAAMGLEHGAGSAFVLARSRTEMVAAAIRLVGDQDFRRRLSDAALAFAAEEFSADRLGADLQRIALAVGQPPSR